MHGLHGKIGRNLFLLVYCFCIIGPFLKLFSGHPEMFTAVAGAIIVLTALFTSYLIRTMGGAGVGEALGILAAALVLAGRFAAPIIVERWGGFTFPLDFWRIIGASTPPLILASSFYLWFFLYRTSNNQ